MPRKTELLVLVPIVAVLVAAGVAYDVIAKREARKAAQLRLDTTAQLTSELISRKVEAIDSILQSTLAQEALANYLMYRESDLFDEAELERFELELSLINAATYDKSIASMSVFDPEGNRVVGVEGGHRTLAPQSMKDLQCRNSDSGSFTCYTGDNRIQVWHKYCPHNDHGSHEHMAAPMAAIEYKLSSLTGDFTTFAEQHLASSEFRLLDANGHVKFQHGETGVGREQAIRASAFVPKLNSHIEISQDQQHALAAFYHSEFMLFLALTCVTLLIVAMTAIGTRYVTRELQRANRELESSQFELVETTRQAKSASKAKSDFLANISHEIRTPMTAILGFSELLKSDELSPAEQRDCLDTVLRNGQHLLTLINQVLDLTKIESGKLEFEIAECDPRELLRDIDLLFRGQAETKGIVFKVEAEGELPLQIETDSTRVKQALVNLVGNAVKFTDNGNVSITAHFDPNDKQLEFRVSDTGIGMTESQLDRIFQPFLQADSSTSRRFGGTGLGLSITRQIVRVLGGEIGVRSKIGMGSVFTLSIPTGRVHDPIPKGNEHEEENGEIPKTAHVDHASAGRILVVDDGKDNRRLLIHVLERANFTVECAENGQIGRDVALQAWEDAEPFDLVLMDLQMPIMDGYESTSSLREEGYRGQIVALTAHALSTDMARCLENGFDGYISKPIERQRFLDEVTRRVQIERNQPEWGAEQGESRLIATCS